MVFKKVIQNRSDNFITDLFFLLHRIKNKKLFHQENFKCILEKLNVNITIISPVFTM